MGMSHELPSHLTCTDEVSTMLLRLYEQWLQEGYYNHSSSSRNEAERRALVQVADQWLASLAKQGKKLVVAAQHCCRYNEGTYHWADDRPWQISEVAVASELFSFASDDAYFAGCYDDCYDKVYCFVTK